MKAGKWAVAALKAAWRRTAAVNLIVTRRCDLACSYCHAVRKGRELDPQDWLRIAQRLSTRFSAFTVSGGEPLLYKGLPDVINGLSRLGIAGLCTNARLIEEDHLRAMSGLDYLNFSIDCTTTSSPSAASSAKTAFGKLPMLAAHGRRNSIEIFGTTVVTSRNLPEVPGIVREMSRHGIPLNLQLVLRPGAEDAFDSTEKIGELGRLQHELIAMKRGGYLIDESEDYIAGWVPHVEGRRAVRCHAGKVYLAVDTDGRLMPCQDTPAVGLPIPEIADLDAALRELPGSIPGQCRCWWNCYHRYQDWERNPWAYLFQAGLGAARGTGRLSA